MRVCSKCGKSKPLSEFNRQKSTKSGRRAQCKVCASEYNMKYYIKNRERLAVRSARYYMEHREEKAIWSKENRRKRKSQALLRLYNITIEEYDEMLKVQGGCCAICGKTPEKGKRGLAVDHDHETGEVRGLLCCGCNTAIGFFQESPEICTAAALYLQYYRRRET